MKKLLKLNMFTFIFCLSIFMSIIFVVADYIDRKHPLDPTLGLVFGHIEISVERPIEMEFERPSPTIFGPDFV